MQVDNGTNQNKFDQTIAAHREKRKQPVEKQVSDAYCELMMLNNITSDEADQLRSLHFRATRPVTRWEAIEILSAYVPSYNDFEPKWLLELPEDAQITIARENSVCLYVKGKINFKPTKCEEKHYNPETDETRLWWD